MIRGRVHLNLGEAGAVELGEVNVPGRARIQVRRRSRTIIDNIDRAVVGGDPREHRGNCRRPANHNRGAPGVTLIF